MGPSSCKAKNPFGFVELRDVRELSDLFEGQVSGCGHRREHYSKFR